MRTSFPYLEIAQNYDVPYGKVIRFAEAFDTAHKSTDKTWSAPVDTFDHNDVVAIEIYIAVINEAERREKRA